MPALPTCDDALRVLLEGWSAGGRPRVLQAAVAGSWEDAGPIAVPAPAATARALVREAGPADADVAVELEWLEHPIVFVGARRAGAAGAFEAAVVRAGTEDPAGPGPALELLAGGSPEEVDHVELGAANAWRSVGPLRLWTRDEGRPPGSLASRLAGHPRLARCVAPVALEVSFRRPRECWVGAEVSERAGGAHVVDPARVEALLERLVGS